MNPVLLAQIVALITSLGPLAIDLIVKLEGLLNLGPDEKANIANAIAASNKADQATIDRVAAWMLANGFQTNVTFTKVLANGFQTNVTFTKVAPTVAGAKP